MNWRGIETLPEYGAVEGQILFLQVEGETVMAQACRAFCPGLPDYHGQVMFQGVKNTPPSWWEAGPGVCFWEKRLSGNAARPTHWAKNHEVLFRDRVDRPLEEDSPIVALTKEIQRMPEGQRADLVGRLRARGVYVSKGDENFAPILAQLSSQYVRGEI